MVAVFRAKRFAIFLLVFALVPATTILETLTEDLLAAHSKLCLTVIWMAPVSNVRTMQIVVHQMVVKCQVNACVSQTLVFALPVATTLVGFLLLLLRVLLRLYLTVMLVVFALNVLRTVIAAQRMEDLYLRNPFATSRLVFAFLPVMTILVGLLPIRVLTPFSLIVMPMVLVSNVLETLLVARPMEVKDRDNPFVTLQMVFVSMLVPSILVL